MSTYESNRGLTYTAGAVIRIGQVVELNTSGQVIPATAASTRIIGVALDNSVDDGSGTEVGTTVSVQPLDGAKVGAIASAAIALGAAVTSAADGEIAAAATGQPVIGYALEAATAADQVCQIVLSPLPGLAA